MFQLTIFIGDFDIKSEVLCREVCPLGCCLGDVQM